MLEEFTVDNFKSLINVTFRPRKHSLLLGVNNAGKTNLCHAMKFLSSSASSSLDQCADLIAAWRVGIPNYYFAKPTVDFRVTASVPFEPESTGELRFQYTLTISLRSSAPSPPSLEVERESLVATGDGFDSTLLMENTRQGVRLLHEADHLKGSTHYADTSAPRETTMLQRLYDLKTNPRANCFKKYLQSWQYYSLSPEAMRGFQHPRFQVFLNADGGNLASVVYHLKTTDERRYRTILRQLQTIEPSIDLINFAVPSEDKVFMFLEDKIGNKLPAANASSGTLRYLALIYILVGQPAFAAGPLVMIEEPENGIYVRFLRDLLDTLDQGPKSAQVVFTSHSPYFIDLFDTRLDGVFVMRRGDQHSTITQPDVQQVKARLEKYPLGEQHFREMLG
jgi:predicted ATPase